MDKPLTRYLRVSHETRYQYRPAVTTSWHRAHLQPSDSPCQHVLRSTLIASPSPTFQAHTLDGFGNRQWFFNQEQTHDILAVQAVTELRTWAVPGTLKGESLAWEKIAADLSYGRGRSVLPESQFAYASTYVPRSSNFLRFSATSFNAHVSLLDACIDLNSRIHKEFEYNASTTHSHTPAEEALRQRSGVCQDFAHIMLACLRSRGLSARYVSGYLMTKPAEGAPSLIGADASHAWVSVYMGEGQWVDFDPTNNRWGLESPGSDYIRLAVGRDYADVSPLRGVIHGGSQHLLEVGVTVASIDSP